MVKNDSESALHQAVMEGHYQVAQLLLQHGADVNKMAGFYGSPLALAACNGDHKIVKLLLDNGADIDERGMLAVGSALQAASAEGHVEVVDLLINQGANINLHGDFFLPPLPLTTGEGESKFMFYHNALQAAAGQGHLQIVQQLLQKGAKDVVPAYESCTPDSALQIALSNGHHEIVKLLQH
ncbi:hypothetical protein G7Y89_g15234 [Cudoniella acicularis]|uniref:Uncharacterized protein n=1 Tax=Cudoniella acicularis TaxID=354080 RepID=A0A8H4VM94_9HELO|nr:hypothetical protein G7Y89_g15234 [Cudoniella acicularis]